MEEMITRCQLITAVFPRNFFFPIHFTNFFSSGSAFINSFVDVFIAGEVRIVVSYQITIHKNFFAVQSWLAVPWNFV